jgi:predicted DNA-binding protein
MRHIERNDAQIVVRTPADLYERIRDLAKKDGVSVATVIRAALRDFVRRQHDGEAA